jgi:hypothetical protein
MRDTSKEIMQKQFEIVSAIPLKERIANLFEMTELSRRIIQNRIKSENPKISEIDLTIETFKVFYRQDFDEHTLSEIIDSMKGYLERQQSTV